MDLALNDRQQTLRDSARKMMETECSKSLVRAFEMDSQNFPRELWKSVRDQGWTSLVLPEEYVGSAAANFTDLVILMEELGRALAPVPLMSSTLCGLAMSKYANREQKGKHLGRIARGVVIPALAYLEGDECFNEESVNLDLTTGK